MGKPAIPATRFDIESEICELYSYAEQLRTLADASYDTMELSQDQLHSALHGMSIFIDAHATKMMETHAKVFRLNQYAPTSEEIFGDNDEETN